MKRQKERKKKEDEEEGGGKKNGRENVTRKKAERHVCCAVSNREISFRVRLDRRGVFRWGISRMTVYTHSRLRHKSACGDQWRSGLIYLSSRVVGLVLGKCLGGLPDRKADKCERQSLKSSCSFRNLALLARVKHVSTMSCWKDAHGYCGHPVLEE